MVLPHMDCVGDRQWESAGLEHKESDGQGGNLGCESLMDKGERVGNTSTWILVEQLPICSPK